MRETWGKKSRKGGQNRYKLSSYIKHDSNLQ